MEPSTKGYSPEQVASGVLEDGRTVTILYVKEFGEQIKRVAASGQLQYYYTWSYKEDSDSYLLFIYWMNDEEITLVFPPNQHSVVENLKKPQELIITATPINIMVQRARQGGQDFLDMEDAVIIREAVFKEPGGMDN